MAKNKAGSSEITRCVWAQGDMMMQRYHDTEWGRPVFDSKALFEKLLLDGFQAGLSWRTILYRRETLRAAFADFCPERIALFDDADRERLLKDPGIIRNRRKIEGAIQGAKAFLRMRDEGIVFSPFLWAFAAAHPAILRRDGAPMPTESEASRAMAKALKKEGFAFCGPTICYAFMQAVGMVADHEPRCFLSGTPST